MRSPTHNQIIHDKHLQKPLDCPSVWFGDLSDTPWAFAFYTIGEIAKMRKEYDIKISVETDGLERVLENIRWKHIDIDAIIEEELEEELEGYVREIIVAYGMVL